MTAVLAVCKQASHQNIEFMREVTNRSIRIRPTVWCEVTDIITIILKKAEERETDVTVL